MIAARTHSFLQPACVLLHSAPHACLCIYASPRRAICTRLIATATLLCAAALVARHHTGGDGDALHGGGDGDGSRLMAATAQTLCKSLGITMLPTIQIYQGARGMVCNLPVGPKRFHAAEDALAALLQENEAHHESTGSVHIPN
jgi:hypothetical protein